MPIGYLLFDNAAASQTAGQPHSYVAGDAANMAGGAAGAYAAAVPFGDVYDTTGATVNDDSGSAITEGLYLFDTENDTAIAVVYANGTDASAGFKPAARRPHFLGVRYYLCNCRVIWWRNYWQCGNAHLSIRWF